LRRAVAPSKESYHVSEECIVSKLILNRIDKMGKSMTAEEISRLLKLKFMRQTGKYAWKIINEFRIF
jgi:hypothetical protein